MLKKLVMIIGVMALAASLVAVGVVIVLDRQAAKHARARAQLSAFIDEVATHDPVVVALDTAVTSETTEETADSVAWILEQAGPTRTDLERIAESVDGMLPDLSGADEPRGEALAEAVRGRIEMIDAGMRIISIDASASVALGDIESGWDALLDAGAHAAEAAASSNLHTPDGYTKSLAENETARGLLDFALSKFELVRLGFPSEDIDRLIQFTTYKIEANEVAIESDQAMKNGALESANALVPTYNELELKASELAKDLLSDPREVVKRAYRVRAGGLLDDYGAARKRTSEADAVIRR